MSIHGDSDIAPVAALFAEPGRARVLQALADGRALPASVLAAEAGLSASAASAHLAKLCAGGLIDAARSGRHRYFRLVDRPNRFARCARAPAPPRCAKPAAATLAAASRSPRHY
ncbi:helix-turn-helix domain-containing protein [Saccharopolyspora spinosa]|uniref:helix-turn-helix domain-containing protein n=1 Tax=Saccharopolyspora spinosa TaxID=60894 RepID=UPI00374839C0